jgi:GGDEF domain-containing protein
MGLALLGVGDLKRVNEQRGEAAGDEILRALGRRLRKEFRSEEIAPAGNKFLVGVYGLDPEGSIRRLEDV